MDDPEKRRGWLTLTRRPLERIRIRTPEGLDVWVHVAWIGRDGEKAGLAVNAPGCEVMREELLLRGDRPERFARAEKEQGRERGPPPDGGPGGEAHEARQ